MNYPEIIRMDLHEMDYGFEIDSKSITVEPELPDILQNPDISAPSAQ